MKMRRLAGVIPSKARNLLFVFFLLPHLASARTPPQTDQELTLSEFRALLPAHDPPHGEERSLRTAGDAIFFDLLDAQVREAAARQSLDRLAGWAKAAQARFDAESAPLLDVEMLRFAEAHAEARLERWEALRESALTTVNRQLGREPNTPLVAIMTDSSPSSADIGSINRSLAARRARYEQLLSQAQELLAKIYQNYLFGGVPLTALLWQEEQTYETELQYRLLLVQAEKSRTAGD